MYDTNPPAPRAPAPRDFPVDVEGIGRFIFGWRTMGDQFSIEIEMTRLCRGVAPTPWLQTMSEWLGTLRILMVNAPAGFDLDDLDPLDDDVYDRVNRVFQALREKEDSFRGKTKAARKGDGQGAVEDSNVLVSPQVQPVSEGPAVS